MLNWIDRLVGWWLDWRIDRAVAANPELHKAGFMRAEFDENGFHLVASFPGVYILADEAARMLEANNAENYVQFDMLPRADRHLEPIRITVQWARGKAPAQRVLELESALDVAIHALRKHLGGFVSARVAKAALEEMENLYDELP